MGNCEKKKCENERKMRAIFAATILALCVVAATAAPHKVFVATWNQEMKKETDAAALAKIFEGMPDDVDIIAVGQQESKPYGWTELSRGALTVARGLTRSFGPTSGAVSRAKSILEFIKNPTDDISSEALAAHPVFAKIKKDFVLTHYRGMRAMKIPGVTKAKLGYGFIQLSVMVRKTLATSLKYTNFKYDSIGLLTSKGASGISFELEGARYAFVNMHLDTNAKKRAKAVQRVWTKVLRKLGKSEGKQKASATEMKEYLAKEFAFVGFMGDLNYRVKLSGDVEDATVAKLAASLARDGAQNLRQHDLLDSSYDRTMFKTHYDMELPTPVAGMLPTYKLDYYRPEKVCAQLFKTPSDKRTAKMFRLCYFSDKKRNLLPETLVPTRGGAYDLSKEGEKAKLEEAMESKTQVLDLGWLDRILVRAGTGYTVQYDHLKGANVALSDHGPAYLVATVGKATEQVQEQQQQVQPERDEQESESPSGEEWTTPRGDDEQQQQDTVNSKQVNLGVSSKLQSTSQMQAVAADIAALRKDLERMHN